TALIGSLSSSKRATRSTADAKRYPARPRPSKSYSKANEGRGVSAEIPWVSRLRRRATTLSQRRFVRATCSALSGPAPRREVGFGVPHQHRDGRGVGLDRLSAGPHRSHRLKEHRHLVLAIPQVPVIGRLQVPERRGGEVQRFPVLPIL